MNHFTFKTAAVCLSAAFSCALAQPLYSVQRGGPSGLPGDAIFENLAGMPSVVGGGPGMGLGQAGDDITALAPLEFDAIRRAEEFIICFSVDPFAVGINRFRITQQNLFRQSLNGQQAGDAYLSTEALERGVGVLPPPFSMGLSNNALGANQSPIYPNDFALLPLASPGDQVPPGTQLDDIDATLNPTSVTPPAMFFAVDAASPSLPNLPGPDSGATIFFDQDIQVGGNEVLYADPFQLGLDLLDQIDGLIIYDDNENLVYDNTDTVYFSLSQGSPTLGAISAQPGDLLVSEGGGVSVFVRAQVFGLAPGDEMNALDLVALVNGSAEDTINTMVPCPSDFNSDGEIDTLDFLAFLNAWVENAPEGDFNQDGAINTLDVLDFLGAWAGGC